MSSSGLNHTVKMSPTLADFAQNFCSGIPTLTRYGAMLLGVVTASTYHGHKSFHFGLEGVFWEQRSRTCGSPEADFMSHVSVHRHEGLHVVCVSGPRLRRGLPDVTMEQLASELILKENKLSKW